ncbi:MAG: hypothetical protein JSV80_08010 [Acidobacteriota bacterium]|nr:MAG: hypothetical protein JSV80_08010 [Acidobacteriota bacterium]
MSIRRLVPIVLVLMLAVSITLADPPVLRFAGAVFGRENINPVPRPFSNRTFVSTDTTIYFEVIVPDTSPNVAADTITATLTPQGGEPIPMLNAGQSFAAGFSGELYHNIDRSADKGEAVYLVPDDPLLFSTTYTVTVYAETTTGEPINPAQDSFSFTTRAEIIDPSISWSVDLQGPTVSWHGWFHSGILKPNFNTSRVFDQLDSYDLMDTVTAINPDAFSLQRDWPLTGDFWMNGVFDGQPNVVREQETRQITQVQTLASNTVLTVTDLEEGPLYGIPPDRPLSSDYHPGDLVTVTDASHYESAEVLSVDDNARTVTVSRLTSSIWYCSYSGSHPPDDPDTPDNFTRPLCYLRKLDPIGTPRYYWARVNDEWDIVHGQHGRRLQVNWSQTPCDLASDPTPTQLGGGGAKSPPKDLLQWHEFSREITLHLIDRYGPATLDFYWSVGNEHNFSTFWTGTKNDFYAMYDVTINAVLTAFEDRGLDASRVIVGGLEAAGLGGVGWTRDALYHMSPTAQKPGGGIEEKNYVCTDPRFADKLSARVSAICSANDNEGSPIDFVSIHEYEHSDLAVSDMHKVRDDSLSIDPAFFDELSVCSFESTADWIPREDPAAQSIHLGGGYLTTWAADWMQRLVARAESDARYARHESVLTVWPFDYNRQGISAWTGLMRVDEDGDGTQDRISTIRKDIFNYAELLAHMSRELDALPAQTVEGIRLAGVRSLRDDKHSILVYAHDKYDNDSRELTPFDVTLSLTGIPWQNSTVRRWRIDRDHSSPYRAFLALPKRDLFAPAELTQLEAEDELIEDVAPQTYATTNGLLEITVPLVVNGVTFVELGERDLDGDGFTDSNDNCPAVFNEAQTDDDEDLRGLACDCDDTNSAVWAAPGEVGALLVEINDVGETIVSWNSQAEVAGPETLYDLVGGSLSALIGSGDFAAATCVANGVGQAPFVDPRPDPAMADGDYTLVRADNSCGTGTFGSSSLVPDPRRGLEDGGASPPDPDPCP